MENRRKTVLVIDGQGGGIGRSLIAALKERNIDASLICAGTNAFAAGRMQSAGADVSVYGEESVIAAATRADIISGPIGIIIPGALKGEISPEVAFTVAKSGAVKILVPLNKCNIIVAGVHDNTLSQNIDETVSRIILASNADN